jgi:hypothetical protein
MAGEQLSIGSWVLVRDACTMHHMINGSDEVEFTFGRGSAVFDFLFSADALHRFVLVGLEALREMEELRAREKDTPGR